MKTYLLNLLIACSQLFNCIFGGKPDETISSRCYRLSIEKNINWPKKLVDAVFFFDPDHCKKSYESEIKRNHFPKNLKNDK